LVVAVAADADAELAEAVAEDAELPASVAFVVAVVAADEAIPA
jgi:hypothetical protein